MKLTLEDLTLMIEELRKNDATCLHLDFTVEASDATVESVDFDLWKNGKFIKTVLTVG